MTDMDIVEFAYSQADKHNVKYNETVLNGKFAGTTYNPFAENRVIMFLYGQNKRI